MLTDTDPTLESPEENGLVNIGGGSGIPFNGNQVKRAVAMLPREQAGALAWLFEHGRNNQFDLGGLAAHLRRARAGGQYSQQMLYAIYRGRYTGLTHQSFSRQAR